MNRARYLLASTPMVLSARMLALLALLLVGASLDSSDWQTYRNEEAGYSVEYPADWSVDLDGQLTRFTSPSGRVGISIGVSAPDDTVLDTASCEPVIVAEIETQTCQDILTFSVWTTVVSRDKAYTVATSAKNYDPQPYAHAVKSFRVLNP
jgi:hypothetical protein